MAQTQSSSRRSSGTSTRFGGGRTPAPSSSSRFGRSSTPQTRGTTGRNVSMRNAQGKKSTSSSGRSLGLVNRSTKTTKGKKATSSGGGLLGTLTKALPKGGAATAAKKGGGKPAGFALAAAAAGVAFRNRGKLTSMMGRKSSDSSSVDVQPHSATQGISDPVVPGQPQSTPPAV